MSTVTGLPLCKASELLVECFFELFEKGLLSDDKFQSELDNPGSLLNVKMLLQYDLSTININDGNLVCIEILSLIVEKMNNYLCKISLPSLNGKLSDFDKSTSEDNFLHITSRLNLEEPLFSWFLLIWNYIFERLSSFEKSITFANGLHSESSKKIEENYSELESLIKNAETSVNEINLQLNGSDDKVGLFEKVSSTETSLDKLRYDAVSSMVTILGIFAAIVLTFSGVFSISSSIFEGMGKVSIYRLIGVSTILGLISFNLLYYMISVLLNKSVKNNKDSKSRCGYLPIWISNIVLLVIFLLNLFAWKHNWLAQRIPKESQYSVTETEIQIDEDSVDEEELLS